MEKLRRSLIAFALAAGAAWGSDSAAIGQLVRQAQFWEERSRPDLAREAWIKVLEADHNHIPALERLVELEARLGDAAKAAEFEARLRALAPGSEALLRRSAGVSAQTARESSLAEARALARAGRSADAVAAYRPLLNAKGEPPADLALEYYETLAGTDQGWAEARAALARLHETAPDDLHKALAYARVLTWRAATRREGIRRLEAIGERPSPVRAEARAALRAALLWLDPSEADRPHYERWLASAGADADIAEKLARLGAGARERQRAAADAKRAEALRAGYDALEAGDLERADTFFSAQVQARPGEADTLAGLGLVRLRQQRFGEAETLLGRAVAARPALRRNLGSALDSARFWRRVNEARTAQQRGLWRDAAAQFAAALALQADVDSTIRRDYAAVLRQAGDLQRAERVLRDGLQREPDDPLLAGELASLLLALDRETEIDALLASASRRDPAALREVRVALLRARAARALSADNGREAETLLQQALAADPENAWVRLDLARLYRAGGRAAEADTLLNALSEMPAHDRADTLLAQAYALADAQRWYETLVVLERLPVAQRGADAIGLQRRAWIQYQLRRARQAVQLGQPEAAIALLNAAIAAAGDSPEHASAIAQGWQVLGDPARAVAAMRRGFSRRPPSPGESIQYAALLLELNQDAEFEAVTTTLIQANAMSVPERSQLEDLIVGYRVKLADRLREGGDIAGAYRQLREVVRRYPDQPRVQSALARLFVAAGDTDKALAIARALMRTVPDDRVIRANAVDAALAAGERAAANDWIEDARARWPDDPAFLRAAARLAEQRGNRAESLRLLRAAAELQDRVRRDSALPELMLIGSDGAARHGLPGPIHDWLQEDPAESVGPLLPRAGDDGPAAAPPLQAYPRYRLDAELGGQRHATAIAMRSPTPVQLRLDSGRGAAWPARGGGARAAPTVDEELRRLEASVGAWSAASFATRSRRGESGLSRLLTLELPIDWATPEWEVGRLGLRFKPVVLDAGEVSGLRNKLRFGTLALINGESGDLDQSADGVAVSLSYRIGELGIDIGTSPLGFEVENLVGGLRWQTRLGQDAQLAAEFSRRPLTDSFLSYAGAYDPLTGRIWGGVVRTGGRLDFAYDLDIYGFYVNGAYYGLGGRNVEENTLLEFGGGLFFRVLRDVYGGDLTLGVNLTHFGYDENLRHFTFGHGGYFSPQFFTTVALPLNWSGVYGRLDYRIEAAFGLQSFREDGAPLFPGRPSLQQELEELVEFEPTSEIPTGYAPQKNSGLAYKFGSALQFRVNPRLAIGGVVSVDNARDYEESLLHVYLRYDFSGRSVAPGSLLLPDLHRGALP